MRESTYKLAEKSQTTVATGIHARRNTLDSGTTIVNRHWDNIQDLVDAPVPEKLKGRFATSVTSKNNQPSWWGHGGAGYATVLEQVKHGDTELYKRLKGMVSKLVPDFTVATSHQVRKRRKRFSSDTGMSIDMDRVYQGNLDRAWTRMRKVERPSTTNKSVAIFINASISGGTNARDAVWRAACALATTDYLTERGYNVKIYVGHKVRSCYQGSSSSNYIFSMKVKDYMQHVSPEYLAVACSVGFFRGLGFKAIMLEDKYELDYGLGRPLDSHDVLPYDFINDKAAGALVVDIGNQATSEYGAKKTFEDIKTQVEGRETAARAA